MSRYTEDGKEHYWIVLFPPTRFVEGYYREVRGTLTYVQEWVMKRSDNSPNVRLVKWDE